MKDYYDEIFNTVTRIGEERLNRKRKILCRIRNASIALSGIAAMLIFGFVIIKNENIKNAATKFQKADEIIIESTTTTDEIIQENTTKAPAATETTISSQPNNAIQATTSNAVSAAITENIKTTQCNSSIIQTNQYTSLITQTAAQTNILSTAENPVTTMTAVTTSVQQLNLTNPDSEIISTYFDEVNILNDTTYKLQYSGINEELIGDKIQTVHIKILDSESGIEYVADAEIYNVNVENSKNSIALKYNGNSELYLYYPLSDSKSVLDCIEFSANFDNSEINYVSCGSIMTNTNEISQYLKDGFIGGYNPFTSEYVCIRAKFYRLVSIKPEVAIAVQYEEDSGYRIFVNNDYAPEALWQFSGDLNILGKMVVNGLYIDGDFYAPDIELIQVFIRFFGPASICDEDVKPCKYRIDLDIPILARYNISFCFDESGYIYTNITGKYAVYYYGKSEIESFISRLNYEYKLSSSN